jgi:hypothetical protein
VDKLATIIYAMDVMERSDTFIKKGTPAKKEYRICTARFLG